MSSPEIGEVKRTSYRSRPSEYSAERDKLAVWPRPALMELMPPKNAGMFDKMLRVVMRIPRGRVATYGDVAYAAGYPGAARQVAWALHGSRGLPWQRVIGAGGKILLGGHAGLEQRLRLEQEGVRFVGLRVDLKAHRCAFPQLRPPKKKKCASES